jgi:glycosyltransferase involved in cell wall biosynthesis
MPDIHAFVLTLNEEIHLARCLESIRDICKSMTVIDSGSTDRTVEIAKSFGAEVVSNPFVNQAVQTNFAIDFLAERGGWLLRLDADEYLCDGTAKNLRDLLDILPADVDGVCLRRRLIFMGKWLKHGGNCPIWLLRVWRNGRGRCENRWMDEHIHVRGHVHHAPLDFADHRLKSISWWSHKHVDYAAREAIDFVLAERQANTDANERMGRQAFRRLVKTRIYNRLPGGLRSFLLFAFRYVVRLGLLDGRAGYYFSILQALWYRTLVDVIIDQIHDDMDRGMTLSEAVLKHTGRRVETDPRA